MNIAHFTNQELDKVALNFDHRCWVQFESLSTDNKLDLLSNHYSKSPQFLISALFRLADIDSIIKPLNKNIPFVLFHISYWEIAITNSQKMWIELLGEKLSANQVRVFIKHRIEQIIRVSPSLKNMLEMILFRLYDEATDNILRVALAIGKGVNHLINQLWTDHNSLLQVALLRKHTHYPDVLSTALFLEVIETFCDRLSEPQQKIIDPLMMSKRNPLFWLPSDKSKDVIANIPVICGLWMLSTADKTWWFQAPEKVKLIRDLIDFDQKWFDSAFNQAVIIAFSLGLHKKDLGG